jgi:hypothetical protein
MSNINNYIFCYYDNNFPSSSLVHLNSYLSTPTPHPTDFSKLWFQFIKRSKIFMYLLLFNVLLTLLKLLEEIFMYNCKMGNKRKMTLMHLKPLYLYLSLMAHKLHVVLISIILMVVVWWFIVFNGCFNNISFISLLSVLLVEVTGVPRENHQPVTSYWQTLSHIVVSSKPCLDGVRTHNFCADRYWMHR